MAKKKAKRASSLARRTSKSSSGDLFGKNKNLGLLIPLFFVLSALFILLLNTKY